MKTQEQEIKNFNLSFWKMVGVATLFAADFCLGIAAMYLDANLGLTVLITSLGCWGIAAAYRDSPRKEFWLNIGKGFIILSLLCGLFYQTGIFLEPFFQVKPNNEMVIGYLFYALIVILIIMIWFIASIVAERTGYAKKYSNKQLAVLIIKWLTVIAVLTGLVWAFIKYVIPMI